MVVKNAYTDTSVINAVLIEAIYCCVKYKVYGHMIGTVRGVEEQKLRQRQKAEFPGIKVSHKRKKLGVN